jgi:acyl dehydratase
MQVNSKMVGRKMKLFQTEISQRRINNYAAAVFDPNPCYLDDTRQEGLIAPPTLAAAITWPLIQNIYDYLDLDFPAEIMFRIVHYSEQLIINRPLKPDDRLTIEGEVAAVIPEKNGTHIIFRLPAVDSKRQPVFTEYIGGMLRGIECTDQGRITGSLPALPPAPSDITGPIWERSVPIFREACYIYEGCADVPFPIHTSPSFARSMGLSDIIYFGIGTLARAVRELVNREANANPTNISHLACYFRGMVLPESFIRIQLLGRDENTDGKELHFRVLNREGKEAVSQGYMRISN